MCFIEMRRLAVSTRYVNASINITDKNRRGKRFSEASENRVGGGASGSKVWSSYHCSVLQYYVHASYLPRTKDFYCFSLLTGKSPAPRILPWSLPDQPEHQILHSTR